MEESCRAALTQGVRGRAVACRVMTNTDFAFLAGEWDTVQRRLVAPLSGSDE